MPLWGNQDAASNSTIFAAAQVNKTANTTNRTNLFANTTLNAFITGVKVGQFGVDPAETSVISGNVAVITVLTGGSGYQANAIVTLSGGGGASATANSTATGGRITAVTVTAGGTSYETAPTVAVAAPAAISFNGSTAVSNTSETIALTTANSFFLPGDQLTYAVAAGNTAIGGLVNGGLYYVVAATTTTIQLSSTINGPVLNLTSSPTSETGHTVTGTTATARAVVSGGSVRGVSHAGWVLRTEGTGGRAGRVQYETLVAMGSMTGDASDDALLPDTNV